MEWSVRRRQLLLTALGAIYASAQTFTGASAQSETPSLPSWNEGKAKQAILEFVRTTTDQSSRGFVRPEDRIATFDQDGTLWVEQPLYTQAMFALDRLRELAPKHPEWRSRGPFKAVLSGDRGALGRLT